MRLRIYSLASFQASLIMESDSLNPISWVFSSVIMPWKSRIYSNEIKSIFSLLKVKLQHIGQAANSFRDALPKLGVDRSSDLLAFTM